MKKIEEGTLLNSTNGGVDPQNYHALTCGEGAFKTMECNQIHCFYPNKEAEEDGEEEDDWAEEQRNLDKLAYCNGNNQMVKIFNLKTVICFESPSVYTFCECGHRCICEDCLTN